ncbi:hypothetical protein D3C75_777100 [compost metagenome]
MWRIQIAAERRRALAEYPGLLEGHGLSGITQVIGMIDANTGDQCHVGIHHVDRVQTTAQTDFQHHRIKPGMLEQPERRQGAHFEVGQRSVATSGLYRSKGLAQLGVSGFDAVDRYPLVVAQQVRGVVNPHFQALGPQQGRHERAGGTLAVGPGDRNHPWRRLAQSHAGRYLLRSLQPHVDGRRVQLFEVGEPFAKGTLGHRLAGTGGTTIGTMGAATNFGVGRPIICASRLPRRGRSS